MRFACCPLLVALLGAGWALAAEKSTGVVFNGPFAARAAEIVRSPSLKVQTRPEPLAADPRVFDLLIEHPQATAALWTELGLQVGAVERLADGWKSTDVDGSYGEFHLLHSTAGLRVYYCTMTAGTRVLGQTLRGEAVLVHRIEDEAAAGYGPSHRLEAYVSIRGPALQVMMRLARGTAIRAIEQACRETMLYFSLLARLVERRPRWAIEAVKRQAAAGDADALSLLPLLENSVAAASERRTVR